jgi:hypothetical protein
MRLKPRPPAEVKAKLSRAEIYAESVLRAMEKKPEDCNLFNELVPHIGNNGLIVYGGEGGGSIDLATSYLKKLSDIHAPHCNQTISHEINIR